MSNKNEVFEYLIDQLRQQVKNNQCEDLAQEVQSLKNQLRDMSELMDELLGTITLMNGKSSRRKEDTQECEHDWRVVQYAAGVETDKCRLCGEEKEVRYGQSGCRKGDTQECEHSWIIMPGLFLSEGNPNNVPGSELCSKCGKREWDDKVYKPKNDTQECEHDWVEFHGLFIAEGDPRNEPGYTFCRKCGLKEYSRKCEHEWSYVMGDGPGFYECDVCGARSETLPYDLRWLA